MATLGDDCYFFFTSSCAKGPACPFRHVEAAKQCKIICQHWQMGACFRPMCKFRHSDFKLQTGSNDIPCYWETQPVGCTKPNCMYRHMKPRPVDSAAATGLTSADKTVSNGSSTVSSPQTIVSPVVKPVVIQPLAESEDSLSSPVKQPSESAKRAETRVQIQAEMKSAGDNKSADQDIKTDNTEDKAKGDKKSKSDKVDRQAEDSPAQQQTAPKKTKKTKGLKKVKKVQGGKTQEQAKKKMAAKPVKKVGVKGTVKAKKDAGQPRKSVKDRLGKAAPPRASVAKTRDSDSDDDSDDSVENIKVMSMEEIFRQKALESMMKKRAAEGKGLHPATKPVKTSKPPATKIQPVTAPSSDSSSSSEEELSSEEEEEEEESSKQASSSSSSASSSSEESSSSSSDDDDDSDDSEQFEPDVRRVVVDVDTEKAARKRAKASLKKKQNLTSVAAVRKVKGGRVIKATKATLGTTAKKNKVLKKRMVNVDYDSDDIVSARVTKPLTLNVRDRLGKPLGLTKAASSAQLSREERFRTVVGDPVGERESPRKTVLKVSRSSDSDDHDMLSGVKVKTLEEIRQEKMRKLAAGQSQTGSPNTSPIKQRLNMSLAEKQNEEGDDDLKGRQVLIVTDSGSKSDDASNARPTEEQKKAKRRPWRSQKRVIDKSGDGGSDERRAVMTTVTASELNMPGAGDSYESELNRYKEERGVDESPFEQLRRKALMKKLQMQREKKMGKSASVGEEDPLEGSPASPRRNIIQDLKGFEDLEAEAEKATEKEKAEDSSGSKKHKHKHKHKHHKKGKIERQIYMPPAMKNSVLNKASSPPAETLSPKREPITAPTAKVAPQKRGPHPIAAAWAAGLALSAKGVVRKPEPVNKIVVGERLGLAERLSGKDVVQPKTKPSAVQPPKSSSESGGVKIKTFSEIMAEKRQRRLEMLAQKSGTPVSSTSAPSLSRSSSSSLSVTSGFPAPTTVSVTSQSGLLKSSPVTLGENKPRVPISPIVFASDSPAKTASRATEPSPQVTAETSAPNLSQPHAAPTSFSFTSSVSSTSASSVIPQKQSQPQKVKLKSGKKNPASGGVGEKKKKGKKLLKKKKSVDITDDSSILTSEDSNMSASSFPSHSLISTPSVSEASLTSDLSHDNSFRQQTLPWPGGQSLSQNLTTSGGIDSTDSPFSSVSAQSVGLGVQAQSVSSSSVTTPSSLTEQKDSSSKQKTPSLSVDSEPRTKKARLSMEDEFSFFDEAGLGEADDNEITDDVEPIDDLLQDIDDLLN